MVIVLIVLSLIMVIEVMTYFMVDGGGKAPGDRNRGLGGGGCVGGGGAGDEGEGEENSSQKFRLKPG